MAKKSKVVRINGSAPEGTASQQARKLTPEMGEILDVLVLQRDRAVERINQYLLQCSALLGYGKDEKINFCAQSRSFSFQSVTQEPAPATPPRPEAVQ